MKIHMLACAGAVLLLAGASAAEQAKPAPAATAAPAAPSRFLPPVRGVAQLGFTAPATKRSGNEVVTTIKVKNLSATNTIVGLKVDEFWYDKGGNPVTGDTYRHKKPMQPEEMIEVVLHTPTNPKMDRNSYKFAHANGDIKTVKMNAKGEIETAKPAAAKPAAAPKPAAKAAPKKR